MGNGTSTAVQQDASSDSQLLRSSVLPDTAPSTRRRRLSTHNRSVPTASVQGPAMGAVRPSIRRQQPPSTGALPPVAAASGSHTVAPSHRRGRSSKLREPPPPQPAGATSVAGDPTGRESTVLGRRSAPAPHRHVHQPPTPSALTGEHPLAQTQRQPVSTLQRGSINRRHSAQPPLHDDANLRGPARSPVQPSAQRRSSPNLPPVQQKDSTPPPPVPMMAVAPPLPTAIGTHDTEGLAPTALSGRPPAPPPSSSGSKTGSPIHHRASREAAGVDGREGERAHATSTLAAQEDQNVSDSAASAPRETSKGPSESPSSHTAAPSVPSHNRRSDDPLDTVSVSVFTQGYGLYDFLLSKQPPLPDTSTSYSYVTSAPSTGVASTPDVHLTAAPLTIVPAHSPSPGLNGMTDRGRLPPVASHPSAPDAQDPEPRHKAHDPYSNIHSLAPLPCAPSHGPKETQPKEPLETAQPRKERLASQPQERADKRDAAPEPPKHESLNSHAKTKTKRLRPVLRALDERPPSQSVRRARVSTTRPVEALSAREYAGDASAPGLFGRLTSSETERRSVDTSTLGKTSVTPCRRPSADLSGVQSDDMASVQKPTDFPDGAGPLPRRRTSEPTASSEAPPIGLAAYAPRETRAADNGTADCMRSDASPVAVSGEAADEHSLSNSAASLVLADDDLNAMLQWGSNATEKPFSDPCPAPLPSVGGHAIRPLSRSSSDSDFSLGQDDIDMMDLWEAPPEQREASTPIADTNVTAHPDVDRGNTAPLAAHMSMRRIRRRISFADEKNQPLENRL